MTTEVGDLKRITHANELLVQLLVCQESSKFYLRLGFSCNPSLQQRLGDRSVSRQILLSPSPYLRFLVKNNPVHVERFHNLYQIIKRYGFDYVSVSTHVINLVDVSILLG